MSDQRDDEDHLVEIAATLEQLQQVKDDAFQMIANLQKAVPGPETQDRAEPQAVDRPGRRKRTRSV